MTSAGSQPAIEMDLAQLPRSGGGDGSLLARAFDGVTPRIVGFVLAVAMVYTLTRTEVTQVVVAFVGDHFSVWAALAAKQFASYVVVAATIFAAVVVAGNMGPRRGWPRPVVLGAAIVGSTLVAVVVRWALLPLIYGDLAGEDAYLVVLRFEGTSYMFLASLLTVIAELHRREREYLDVTHQAEIDRSNLERQMAQARVQVLQAQIEPHFLFNTLANVRRLYEADREAGHAMLDNLMRYFEVALPEMRCDASTLERERALIESYLNIQQIRFGRRLSFSIDMPESLRTIEVPPMMLLTLVENALKHGIGPLPEGGSLKVSAELTGEFLILTVADTGRGLTGDMGAGTGLVNIRSRLSAAYGIAASLSIDGNSPRGIVARLTLPANSSSVPRLASAA